MDYGWNSVLIKVNAILVIDLLSNSFCLHLGTFLSKIIRIVNIRIIFEKLIFDT